MELQALRATAEMAEDMGRVHALSWQAAYRGIVPDEILLQFTPEARAAVFLRKLRERPEEFYAFRSGGKIVGQAVLGAPQEKVLEENAGEIHALYFVPEAWGTGLGGQAMAFCLRRLRELGFGSAVLWVLEENLRARRFYEKNGFSPTGESKEMTFGRPLRVICYGRKLGGPA